MLLTEAPFRKKERPLFAGQRPPTSNCDVKSVNSFVSSGLHKWKMLILSKQVAAFDAGQPNKPILANTPRSSEQLHWQEVCITSAIDISGLLERHRIDWGNDQFPVILMRPASLAPFALFEGLSQRPQSQQALVELCINIAAASRRFRVGKGILETIANVAARDNVELPPPCYRMIDAIQRASEENTPGTHPRPAPIGVEYLLEKWEDLRLD